MWSWDVETGEGAVRQGASSELFGEFDRVLAST